MIIRKLITALFMAMCLLALTSAWMPSVAHAACIAGLNGLICPPTPAAAGGASSGGSDDRRHKRPTKTPFPTQTSTPTTTPPPTPTFTPTSVPPLGGPTGHSEGNAGAAQNPGPYSSGYPWAATVVEYWWLALIMILVPTAAGLIVRGKRQHDNPILVRGNSFVDRDAATGLPSGQRLHKQASVVTRDAESIPLPGQAEPSPIPTPYPNVMLNNTPVSRVEPGDITITKTVDKGSATIAKDAG